MFLVFRQCGGVQTDGILYRYPYVFRLVSEERCRALTDGKPLVDGARVPCRPGRDTFCCGRVFRDEMSTRTKSRAALLLF